MRLGARIFKTGLAVTLALYVGMWLQFSTPAFAALAAFLSVQPSVRKSIMSIWDQIQANVISALLAIVFVLTFGHEPFVVGVVVLLIIAIHIKWKKEGIIPLAVVTAILIMGSPTDDFSSFALDRFLLIMVGVFSAFIVNLIFLPPKHENLLYHKVTGTNEQILQWIRLILHHEIDHRTFKQDQQTIATQLGKLDTLFDLYKDERTINRKNEYARLRKVVLFRQMIIATKKAEDILVSLSKHDNVTHNLPEEIECQMRSQLDELTNYHDRILLKYAGKVRPQSMEEYHEEIAQGKRQLVDVFMSYQQKASFEYEAWMHFFPVIALVIEYSEELEHLDKLVDGFFTYHTEDNEVEVTDREI
ncbi:aromatic acid exporter family protein [Paenalkalicoccus suaedae]|uniref:Aromatic acid exporter family protein n=1 Tax=Paenalkalicoccus suaedae TaxID=2592382 RepID=A0A859FDH3_9BACI|nr:aromatic acid exporter family protein [Paenalkalicoccus suaedae]QKS70624.1 aromatic acid exporter family protein [Paenalkalicoccus suaedae]